MLKFFLLISAATCSLCSVAQDFPGFRTSNYSGVNGVAFNPANLADNRYGFDFNLVSLNTSVGNNQLSFNLKTIGETFSGDKLENTFLQKNSGRTNALLGLTLNTPSFMFSAGRNLGFAVTTRARMFGTIKDLEGRLLSSETDENGLDPNLPYSFGNGADMKVAAHVFSEIGVSGGFVVLNKDEHFIKGGITAKYLIGVGNAFYNISGLSGTIDQESDDRGPFLRDANGRVAIGMGGVNIDGDNFDELFSTSARGFGADLGFVFEWRPDYEKYKTESGDLTVEKNKYKLKFGVALNDIGHLKYAKDMDRSADYNVNIAGTNRVYIDEIGAGEDETINDYFKSRPDAFTPVAGNSDETYTVNLPTTLNVEIDYQIKEKVYVNLHTMLPVGNSTLPANNKLYTNIAVTPRFETRGIGFYLPVQYNALTKLNAGFAMRLGPLFLGSGSVLTALLGNSKQADVHVGLRFGTYRRDKHKKAKKEDKELSSGTN